MKGVVMQTIDKQALILKQDGSFVRLHNRNYSVGDEVNLAAGAGQRRIPLIISMAASLILMLTVSAYAYFTPYSYISLDINPSIEYTTNRFDRIIEVRTNDAESNDLIHSLQLRHTSVTDAIHKTAAQLYSRLYLKADQDNQMVIAVASANEEHGAWLIEHISDTLQRAAEQNQFRLQIHTSQETTARVMEARQMGTTFGKLRLIERLRESSSDPTAIEDRDWIHSSVQDIVHQMDKGKIESPDPAKENANGNHNRESENDNSSIPPSESGGEGDTANIPLGPGEEKSGKQPSVPQNSSQDN